MLSTTLFFLIFHCTLCSPLYTWSISFFYNEMLGAKWSQDTEAEHEARSRG